MQRCRKLVGLLGCAGAGSVEAYQPVATQGIIGSSSHAPSSSRLVGEEEEEEDEDEEATHEEEEEEDESNGEEEYDEDYGPPPTQTSQASQLPKRNPKKKDLLSPDPFQRPVPRRPKKKTEETRSKSNEDRTSKRGRSN
mgnify:CR=1 FL=1